MKLTHWSLILLALALIGAVVAGIRTDDRVASTQSQVSQLRQQVTSLHADITGQRAIITADQAQLAAAVARLTGASTTGTVVTCADLRLFEENIQVSASGSDAYGNPLALTGIASSSWLPQHCYKS